MGEHIRNYVQGAEIKSLDELAKQKFIFYNGELYNKNWVKNWQIGWCLAKIRWEGIYYAIRREDDTNGK